MGMRCQVADFGMARQLDVQSRIDTFSCGTITHTAPELMDEGVACVVMSGQLVAL